MAGRRGGLACLESRPPASRGLPTFFGDRPRTYADPEDVVGEIARHGGTVVERVEGRGLARIGQEDPVVCRLVVSWRKGTS